MKINYIAFDSFGVKSSCVLVRTGDIKVCIDPGIAAEVDSFPLSKLSRSRLKLKYMRKIARACEKAEVIVISHYHYDHCKHIKEWYKDKIILIKDPKKFINKSQKERAKRFLELVKDTAKKIEIADGKEFEFGNTKIRFSKPLFHGVKNTRLGYVIMCSIDDGKKKLLHSSDIDGPIEEEYVKLIIKESPDLLILDGAPTYLLGYIHSFRNLCRAVLNLIKIIRSNKVRKIVLDHHLLRDYRYRDLYYAAFQEAKEQCITLRTAAEEIGEMPMVIKAYKKHGPTKWKKWEKVTKEKLKNVLKSL